MTPKDFSRIARDNGLTCKQLIKLSMCQSEIYHRIRFDGLANFPESSFSLARLDGREQRSLEALLEKKLIAIDPQGDLAVTTDGWRIPCNAGAMIYINGADDIDVISGDQIDPLTRFGPQFPAFGRQS